MTGMKFVTALVAVAVAVMPVAAAAAEQNTPASSLSIVNSLPKATPKAKRGNEAVSGVVIGVLALVVGGVGVALVANKNSSPKSP